MPTIQIRSLKRWWIWRTQLLKNLLSILSIWIRNDDFMNEEDDKVEWSRWSLPMKQIKDKYSIAISWYCFVMHLIVFSWCVMHDILFKLILLICMWWERSYTTSYKKRRTRLVLNNKWWKSNKHESEAPRVRYTMTEERASESGRSTSKDEDHHGYER